MVVTRRSQKQQQSQEVESPLETQPEEHDSVPENPPILDEEHPLGEDFYGGAVEDGHHAAYDDDEFAMGGGPEHEEAHGEAERVAESNTQEAYTEEDDYLESLSDLREGAIEGEHLENDVPSEHGPIGDAIPGEGEEVEPRAEDDDEIDVTGMDGDSPVRKPKRKSSKSKKAPKEKTPSRRSTMSSDFLSALSGSGGSSRSKKKKIDPNKPLIVDGAPVNPMSEPAKPNAYGYDPAMDIVALGKGQLKSAYRRTKTQLDTPQIDAKKYRIEIKHDHLLDDEDAPPMTSEHDDLEAPDSPGPSQRLGDLPIQFSPLPPHHPARIVPPSPPPSGKVDPPPPRRASFMPAMISPVSTGRRVSAGNGTGWEGNGSGRKRRLSDRPDEEPAARQTRLSMAEQFPMGAPKIIDAPLRLGSGPAPSASTTPSRTSGEEGTNGRTSAVTPSSSFSGPSTPNGSRTEGGRARERDPKNLSLEAFISRLQYLTYDLKECNRALATNAVSNGN